MHSFSLRACVLFAIAAIPASAFAQVAPPDVLEPVSEPPNVLSAVEDRNNALDLLDRARRNYRSASGGHPFTLKASFTATGQTAFEGDGIIQESVSSDSRWRMTAKIGSATFVRLATEGHMYGNSATEPMPLRLQLIWTAIFNPVPAFNTNSAMLRSASVTYKGGLLTCVLSSGWVATEPVTRFYQEREACVDPETHLLRVWSQKPGIYAEYDYAGAIDFHGNIMARQITITEAGSPTVVIRIDSLEDLTETDEATLKATAGLMKTFPVAGTWDFPMHVPSVEGYAPNKRVIVHASIDALDGKVVEAEALQTTDPALTRAALEAVKAQHFTPTGMQREAFINVMFNLPR